jgi:uncharacterized protein YxeA
MKMDIKLNNDNKEIGHGLFIAGLTILTLAIISQTVFVESVNTVLAQQQQQQQQQQSHVEVEEEKEVGQQGNQTSIAHNAKGHESHQVIIFQDSSDGLTYSGTVTFNLSKPADVISFEEVTEDPTNATKKIWEVGDKKYVPNTLLKNVTNGSVNFNGSGILAHSTQDDVYTGSYTVNDTATRNP